MKEFFNTERNAPFKSDYEKWNSDKSPSILLINDPKIEPCVKSVCCRVTDCV